MCPGNDESAGKRRSGKTRKGSKWLRDTLVQAAHAVRKTKGTYLASQYARLRGRRGSKRASVAVGHSILVCAYHVLSEGVPYQELGEGGVRSSSPFLRDLLAEHLASRENEGPDAFVFTGSGGGLLRNSNFRRRVWKPAVRALGLPSDLRIHDLRHTCAALLIAQGAHPKAIQAQLGHSSIQVTLDLYGHLFPDDMDRLAEQLDAAHEAASGQIAASVRPGDGAEVIELPRRAKKMASEQHVSEWS